MIGALLRLWCRIVGHAWRPLPPRNRHSICSRCGLLRPGAAALLALALVAVGACSPYRVAWQSTAAVVQAQGVAAHALATWARAEHARCLAAHGAQSDAYAACVRLPREALRQWQDHARPAIRSAVAATVAALEIAERAKVKADWMTYLRPGACALLRVCRAWAHLWPDRGQAVLGALGWLEPVACTGDATP
jgi:hypothetical protein